MPLNETSTQTRPSLLIRLRDNRDREAWISFVETYAPIVHGFLRRQQVQEADALDIVQDVLITVSSDIGKFEHRSDRHGSFRKWLFTIVRHRMTDHWRQEGGRPTGTGDSDVQQVLTEVATQGDELDERWDRQYLETVFRTAAGQVKHDFQPTTWEAFWQTAVLQKPPKVVVAETGLSLRAVYLAKGRVLRRLQEQIEFLEGDVT